MIQVNTMRIPTHFTLAISLVVLCFMTQSARGQSDPSGRSGEQEVDLGQLDQEQSAATSEPTGQASQTGEQEVSLDQLEKEQPASQPSGPHPTPEGEEKAGPFKFKLFFDLLLQYEFKTKKFGFTSDHAYIMLEVPIVDWLNFRTDVSPSPKFYEIIFSSGNTLELRVGKILIPFGQNDFHHLIGGRVDKESLFLPVIWADYGLAFKHLVYEGDTIGIDYSLWVVNGFSQGTDIEGQPYPSKQAGSLSDNNAMKGVGIRPVLRIGTTFTLGTSWYLDAWDDDDGQFMLIYGADVEFGYGFIPVPVLRNLRIRGEVARGEVDLPQKNWMQGIRGYYGSRREGFNLEFSYRIVPWLSVRYRLGYLDPDYRKPDPDHRYNDVNDLIIHEPGIIARFGPLQWSLLLQLHDILYHSGESVDNSCIFTRLLLRY